MIVSSLDDCRVVVLRRLFEERHGALGPRTTTATKQAAATTFLFINDNVGGRRQDEWDGILVRAMVALVTTLGHLQHGDAFRNGGSTGGWLGHEVCGL